MPWFRIDDAFGDHPKLVALEADPDTYAQAVALWTVGGCYCARHLTDGRLPKSALRRLVPFDAMAGATALLSAGLWQEDSTCYIYHDWLDWNPSRDELCALREKKRKAGKIGAKRRWGQGRGSDGTGDGTCHPDATWQVPSPSHGRAIPIGMPPSHPIPSEEDLTREPPTKPSTRARARDPEPLDDARLLSLPLEDLTDRAAALGVSQRDLDKAHGLRGKRARQYLAKAISNATAKVNGVAIVEAESAAEQAERAMFGEWEPNPDLDALVGAVGRAQPRRAKSPGELEAEAERQRAALRAILDKEAG